MEEADASDITLEIAAEQHRLRAVMAENNARLAKLRQAVAESAYPEPGCGVPAATPQLQAQREAREALLDDEWGSELVAQYQRCCLWRTLVASMERGVRDQEPDFNKRKSAVRLRVHLAAPDATATRAPHLLLWLFLLCR